MRSTLSSPSAVLARLEVASDEGGALKLRVSDGTELHGIVGLPEDRSTVDLLTDQTVVKLRIGAPAHVSITGPNGALSFYSGVVEIKPDGRVLLELPRVVRVFGVPGREEQVAARAEEAEAQRDQRDPDQDLGEDLRRSSSGTLVKIAAFL